MALTTQEKNEILRDAMRIVSRKNIPIDITKAEFLDAIDDLDAFIESNQAVINLAIPQPARGSLTSVQKSWLFAQIALKRAPDVGGE